MYIVKDKEIWKMGYLSIDRMNKYGSISMNMVESVDDTNFVASRTTPIISEIFEEYFGDDCNIYETAKEYILMFDTYFEGCEWVCNLE